MLVVLFILLLIHPQLSWAQDYRSLSIEEQLRRADDAKIIAQQQISEMKGNDTTDDAFEQEKKALAKQLDIITGDEDTKYSIVIGDTVQVRYMDRGDMVENVYQVNGEGIITLPLVGDVKVTGLNRGEARDKLNQLMMEYIRNPQLTVDINTAGKYMILGAAGPGVYELQPNVRLMEALLKAGIDQNRANLSNVLIFRQGHEKPQVLRLNIKKMMVKGDVSDNVPLKPNDIVYVPNSLFFDIDNFKDKLFQYITDYYTLGGSELIRHRTQTTTVTTP